MDNIILGENCIFSSDPETTGLNNNCVVFGPTGCGKTMSITEPCLLEANSRSLVITVTKRRIIDMYRPLLHSRGYEVMELNFVHPNRSDVGYDPLRLVTTCQDITFLAESIVKSNPKKAHSNADPYWDDAAVSLLSAEIAYIKTTMEKATFADVLKLHDNLRFRENSNGQITTSMDEQFEKLERMDPSCFAVSCWRSFRQLPIKTASCVYGSLNTTIDTIFSRDLRKVIEKRRQVRFDGIANRKTVLFVVTSPVNPALHCYVNIFYRDLFKQLFEFAEQRPDGMLPIPVHVVADDFATGSRIPNFPEYISIFREKRVSVTLLMQSESQLEGLYGSAEAVTIINNCDTYIYLGGMDIQTARSISVRLNVPLEDVLYMPLGREILFRRGQKPIVTTRYNIRASELYQEVLRHYQARVQELERR